MKTEKTEQKPQEKKEEKPEQKSNQTDQKEAEIKQLNEKINELTNTIKYVQAEFENYKKRVQRDSEEYKKFACAEFVKNMLEVIDNLDVSMKNIEMHPEKKDDFIKGIKLVHNQLNNLLAKHCVKKICTKGKFNPEQHEALMAEESEKEEGTITEEFSSGYQMHGRTLRTAKVKVAKKKK